MNGWKRLVSMVLGLSVAAALHVYTQTTRAQDAPVVTPDAEDAAFPQPGPLPTPGTPGGTDAATLTGAQPAQVRVEFSGTVQNAGATSIVINGVIVEGAPVNLLVNQIAPGMNVRVEAMLTADGRWVAEAIQLLSPALLPGIVRLSGILSAYNGDFVVLVGAAGVSQIIDINSTALDFREAQIGQPLALFVTAVGVNQWRGLAIDTAGASAASELSPYLLAPVSDNTTPASAPVSVPVLPLPSAVPTPGLPATTDAPRTSTGTSQPPVVRPEVEDDSGHDQQDDDGSENSGSGSSGG